MRKKVFKWKAFLIDAAMAITAPIWLLPALILLAIFSVAQWFAEKYIE